MGPAQPEVQRMRKQQDEGGTQTVNNGEELRLQQGRGLRHGELPNWNKTEKHAWLNKICWGIRWSIATKSGTQANPTSGRDMARMDERLGKALR